MSECSKQLPNTIAVACAARVPRHPVRNGNTQRRSRIWKKRVFRILAQTREHTSPTVSDHELEGAVVRGINDNAIFRSAAVFKHIVLQLAKRTHQAADEPCCQPRCNRGVLGVLRPLLPGKPFRVPSTRVRPGQGEHPGAIACAGTADRSIPEREFDLVKYWCFDHDAAVSVWESSGGHREFNQRPNPSRPTERDGSKLRQPPGDRLPQEIVGRLEACVRPPLRSLVQVSPVWSCRLRSICRQTFCHLPPTMRQKAIIPASAKLYPNTTAFCPHAPRGKWHGQSIGVADLHTFHSKIEQKAAWTCSLFVSNSGFTDEGLAALGRGKRVICMDGLGLYERLDREMPLPQVVDRKIRRATKTSSPLIRASDLFP